MLEFEINKELSEGKSKLTIFSVKRKGLRIGSLSIEEDFINKDKEYTDLRMD